MKTNSKFWNLEKKLCIEKILLNTNSFWLGENIFLYHEKSDILKIYLMNAIFFDWIEVYIDSTLVFNLATPRALKLDEIYFEKIANFVFSGIFGSKFSFF